MIKLIFGFILGCVFTFYSYPLVRAVLTQVGIVEMNPIAANETTTPSYTLNPNPPVSLEREHKFDHSLTDPDELNRLMKAVNIAKSSPQTNQASEFVVNVIADFVRMHPEFGAFIRDRIHGGLNNKEALEIMSKYVSAR